MTDPFRPDASLRGITNAGDVLADLARVKALFQARTVALVLGAAPPSPELFASETNKDRSGKHGSEVA